MATADRILALKLIGDVSSIDKTLKGTEGKLSSLGRAATSWGKAFAFTAIIEGIDMVTDALGDAWEGYKAGEKVQAQLANTWKNMGLESADLAKAIDEITASTRALGTSDDEAIAAFNMSIKTTGDYEESMKRLAIAQDLVATGSATNLESALKIVDMAAKGSAKAVDKFGLTAEDAAGRVDQLGAKVAGAASTAASMEPMKVMFNKLNEDLENIVGGIASGDLEGAFNSFKQLGTDVAAAWDEIFPKIQTAFQNVDWQGIWDGIVTTLKDIGPKILQGALDLAGTLFEGIVGAIREADWPQLLTEFTNLLKDLADKFMDGAIELGGKLVDGIINFVGDADWQAIFDSFATMLGDLASDAFDLAVEVASGIVDAIINFIVSTDWGKIFNEVVGMLGDLAVKAFKAAVDVGKDIIDGIINTVMGIDWLDLAVDIFTGILSMSQKIWQGAIQIGGDIVKGIIDTVASIDWINLALDIFKGILSMSQKVWQAAGNIGAGILNGITGWIGDAIDDVAKGVKGIINSIIRLWNQLDFGIDFDFNINTGNGDANKLLGMPKEGLNFGMHTGDLIPDIKYLASGGIVTGPTLAMIGEAGNEAVIPLDKGGVGNTYNINVSVSPFADPSSVGKEIIKNIKAYEARGGKAWRAA